MDLNKEMIKEKAHIEFENKAFNENVSKQNLKISEEIKNWDYHNIVEYNKPVKIKRGFFKRLRDFFRKVTDKIITNMSNVQ